MSDNQIKLVAEESNMASRAIRVLCVDDEEFNLDILDKHLKKSGYEVVTAADGQKALDILKRPRHGIDVILLDRMMPVMDGMELLRKVKADSELKDMPVIMQTAAVGTNEAVEGIEAGAYYYVTKPYEAEMLLSIVAAAVRDIREGSSLKSKVTKKEEVQPLIKRMEFEVITLKEARALASYLAGFASDPSKAIIGLTALMVNAIEHGNLEIGFEKKNDLLKTRKWEQEIERRLALPKYKDRKVKINFERTDLGARVVIKDEGAGFNWKDYLEFDPARMVEPSGRGIAMANVANPGVIKFTGTGNQVIFTIK